MEVDATRFNRVVELQKLLSEVREKLYFFIDMSNSGIKTANRTLLDGLRSIGDFTLLIFCVRCHG